MHLVPPQTQRTHTTKSRHKIKASGFPSQQGDCGEGTVGGCREASTRRTLFLPSPSAENISFTLSGQCQIGIRSVSDRLFHSLGSISGHLSSSHCNQAHSSQGHRASTTSAGAEAFFLYSFLKRLNCLPMISSAGIAHVRAAGRQGQLGLHRTGAQGAGCRRVCEARTVSITLPSLLLFRGCSAQGLVSDPPRATRAGSRTDCEALVSPMAEEGPYTTSRMRYELRWAAGNAVSCRIKQM